MTEYWVSQAKYFCKYCNMWMQDNKMSRAHHDNGVKHKERVELFNKKKRDEKFHGMRSEQELRKQMDMIERSAREAMAADRAAAAEDGQPPPPPLQPGFRSADMPSAAASRRAGSSGQSGFRMPGNEPDGAATDSLRQDSSGTYTVRGVTYYEGQLHEDKIRTGVECEIFVEAEDEWLPARVLVRKEFPIPHTDRVQLIFDIKYTTDRDVKSSEIELRPNNTDAPENKSVKVEKDVHSDRLRLCEAADGTVGVAGIPVVLPTATGPVLEEATGIGVWQTVSVQVVDEEEERLRQLEQEKLLEQERESSASEIKQVVVEDSAESGDVLKAYDPYNRGMYKGIKVSRETSETEIESLAKGKNVSFKKRKVNNGSTVSKRCKLGNEE